MKLLNALKHRLESLYACLKVILRRSMKNASNQNPGTTCSNMNEPRIVILHCAVTPDSKKKDPGFDRFGAEDIDRWHRRRGFDEIGYHYVIRRTGEIEQGRDPRRVGAHCEGYNYNSLGVCLMGTREFTVEQMESVFKLIRRFRIKYGIKIDRWYGHYEFNHRKDCPNIPMICFRHLLRKGFDGNLTA